MARWWLEAQTCIHNLYKSCGEPSLLDQCAQYKFGPGVIYTTKIAHCRTLLNGLWQSRCGKKRLLLSSCPDTNLCITYFSACGKIDKKATTKKIGKNLQLIKGQMFWFGLTRVGSGWTRSLGYKNGLSRVGSSGVQTGVSRVGPQGPNSGWGRVGLVGFIWQH